MASKAIAGFKCDVLVSTSGNDHEYRILGEMRDTSITVNQEPIDVTSYSTDGWLEYICGLRSWEASTEGLYISSDAGLQIVRSWILNADREEFLHWAFIPKRTKFNSSYYTGKASVDSLEIGIPYEDGVNASFSMTGSGKLERKNYEEATLPTLLPEA
jgi:predicted secreted protein